MVTPGQPGGISANGVGACADRNALQHQCRFLNSFYNGLETLDDGLGFCVPTVVWGDCTLIDPATLQTDPNDPESIVFGCLRFADLPPG
jgi:hypothetical protein